MPPSPSESPPPLPLIIGAAVLAAAATTAIPGFTAVLQAADSTGAQVTAIAAELCQALAMAALGMLAVLGRGRRLAWPIALVAAFDLCVVAVFGFFGAPMSMGEGLTPLYVLGALVGTAVALAIQAAVIGIVWGLVWALARSYRRALTAGRDRADARAWTLALAAAGSASAVHVAVKAWGGPVVIGVAGAVVSGGLAIWRLARPGQPTRRALPVFTLLSALAVVTFGVIVQARLQARDRELLLLWEARRMVDSCARPLGFGDRSLIESDLSSVSGVSATRVTRPGRHDDHGLVVWVATPTGTLSPELRRSVEQRVVREDCPEDHGRPKRRTVRAARVRSIDVHARRAAEGPSRSTDEIREELQFWLDEDGEAHVERGRVLRATQIGGWIVTPSPATLAAGEIAVLGSVQLDALVDGGAADSGPGIAPAATDPR